MKMKSSNYKMSPAVKSVGCTGELKQIEDEKVITLEPQSIAELKSPESTDTRAKKIRRRAKSGDGGIQQLSEELLLEILCRVPPEELNACKCVCKSWSRLLDQEIYNYSFVNSNLPHSTPSILFFEMSGVIPISGVPIATLKRPRRRCFASPSSRFKFHKLDLNWLRERILATTCFSNRSHRWVSPTSSDGALLITSFDGDCCVVNPLTRQSVVLPHFKHRPERTTFLNFSAIARIPNTWKYKVLTVGKAVNGSTFAWYVLTIGTNMSWELLSNLPSACIPSVSCIPSQTDSISIGGNIYVPFLNDNFTFAAFDLYYETAYSVEIPAKIKAEQQMSMYRIKWKLLQMDKHLGCTKYNLQAIEIWILEDFCRSEWILTLSIDVSSSLELKHFSSIYPCIWLQSGQVLLMRVEWFLPCRTRKRACAKYLAYFVSTKTCQSLKSLAGLVPYVHRYSLAPLF